MGAKLLTTVPGLPEANLLHVANWVGLQLVDDTLVVEVTHGLTTDLLVQVVELADHGATVETKSDRLQLFQRSIVQMLVTRVLHSVVHFLVPDANLVRHVSFVSAHFRVLGEIELVEDVDGVAATCATLLSEFFDLVFEKHILSFKIVDFSLQFLVHFEDLFTFLLSIFEFILQIIDLVILILALQ